MDVENLELYGQIANVQKTEKGKSWRVPLSDYSKIYNFSSSSEE